jgi:hypothetical protein
MNRLASRTLTITTILYWALALLAGEVVAQQAQRVSFKNAGENSKYTQQLTVAIGDVPNHNIR